jgi:signal peptidase I
MGKTKNRSAERAKRTATVEVPKHEAADPGAWSRTARETVESVVIAFVLAFLFRTFEAEAFVIPTGSMAPTLMGRHMDLKCPKCGYHYQVGAPDNDDSPAKNNQVAICPLCGYRIDANLSLSRGKIVAAQEGRIAVQEVNASGSEIAGRTMEVAINADVYIDGKPGAVSDLLAGDTVGVRADDSRQVATEIVKGSPPDYLNYNGDRILVNKFAFDFTAPKRWDVIVFKYPEDAKTNYIKRLIGLPGEVVRIRDGDIAISHDGGKSFEPARKEPAKLRAMLQMVYDNDYVYEPFLAKGWPARWKGDPGWSNPNRDGSTPDPRVFVADGKTTGANPNDITWLHYYNYVPTQSDWDAFERGLQFNPVAQPITDTVAYDEPRRYGSAQEIVSDLAIECEVTLEQAAGKLVLQLSKAGRPFGCEFDLATGKVRLALPDLAAAKQPQATAGISRPGTYRLLFANVDHQLTLSIDDKPVQFDKATTYDEYYGEKQADIKFAESGKSPVQIGIEGASLRVEHLRVLRDIYYTHDMRQGSDPVCYPTGAEQKLREAGADMRLNDQFYFVGKEGDGSRREDQFFPLGDNSQSSLDGRYWASEHFVDRRLMVGKALFIYWPHSFDKIRISDDHSIPFPFFPNFGRMGFVR